ADCSDRLDQLGLLILRQSDEFAVFRPGLARFVKELDLPRIDLDGGLGGVSVYDRLQIRGQRVKPFLAEKSHRENKRLIDLGYIFGGIPKMHRRLSPSWPRPSRRSRPAELPAGHRPVSSPRAT